MTRTRDIYAALVATLVLLLVATGILVSRPNPFPDDAEVLGVTIQRSQPPHSGQPGQPPHAGQPGPPDHAAEPRTFGISGDLEGLYPGYEDGLAILLTNPNPFDIVVDVVQTEVGTPSNAGCFATHLTVGGLNGSVDVPANGSASTTLPASMPHGAPDACQGASFPLTYSGTGTRANQQ